MASKLYVLDYSAGRLTGAQVKAYAGKGVDGKAEPGAVYVGAIRYGGSPGQRQKEAVKAELDSYVSNGLGVAVVYETTAGWWRGGRQAGINAAHAILADVTEWGYANKMRAYFFTADEDVTASTLPIFKAAIQGAVSVLGYDRTGAYGEADVIDACVGGKLCRWGWQTLAWSAHRVSAHAHILQLIGYVYPGNFNADRSEVLAKDGDWGQYPAPKGSDDLPTPKEVWDEKIPNPSWAHDKLASVGAPQPGFSAYKAGDILSGTAANVGYMIGLLEKRSKEDAVRDAANTAALTSLADALKEAAQGQTINVPDLVNKIGERIENAVLKVTVTVDDNTTNGGSGSGNTNSTG